MAKRFTDTEKWKKSFIRSLPSKYKLFWLYLLDDCSNCGIWEVDMEVACLRVGETLDKKEALLYFNKDEERVFEFDKGKKWFMPGFVIFQYGEDFNPKNKLHQSVKAQLAKLCLFKLIPVKYPLERALEAPKEKDKEKDKEIKGVVRGDEAILGYFELFWDCYPARDGKKIEKKDTLEAFKKIPLTEHNLVVTASRNYANSGRLPKDPKRFLKDGYWREWIEAARPDTPRTASLSAPKKNKCPYCSEMITLDEQGAHFKKHRELHDASEGKLSDATQA